MVLYREKFVTERFIIERLDCAYNKEYYALIIKILLIIYFLFSIDRSISAILRTSNSQSNNQSIISTTSAASDHPPVSRRRFVPSRKSSLPRFVRSSSRDSSIDDSLRSMKSRFRFWS